MTNGEQQIVGIPKYIDHGFFEVKETGAKYNYLMMDYISESINEYLKKPEKERLSFPKICIQMLVCLRNIHKAGYLHRDVKPENFRIKDN